jgi:hypothetical protein
MTSPRLTTWLLSSLGVFASTNCQPQRDPEPAFAQVSYGQTQCADPWGLVRSTAQLETTATAYLAKQSITLVRAHASQVSTEATCNACTCGTGVVLTGQVAYAQVAAIQALGFTIR